MCVCVDFFVWRKNHWTLRIWGVWMCFLAGFFWISKPPGTWDPMILRVKKELRFLACILSIFCECAWLELFFHRVSLVVDISNRSFWICVMGFMDFFNASFESRKKIPTKTPKRCSSSNVTPLQSSIWLVCWLCWIAYLLGMSCLGILCMWSGAGVLSRRGCLICFFTGG